MKTSSCTWVMTVALLALAGPAMAAPAPETFARLAEITGAELSPNADRLAVSMRVKGRIVLNILRLADMKSIGTIGLPGEQDIADVYWVTNERLLVGMAYHEGKDDATVATGDLVAVNVDGSSVVTLLGPERGNLMLLDRNYRDWDFVDRLKDDPDNVLVSKYETTSPLPYLYRLNVKTGARTRVMQARYRYGGFMTDHDGKVRVQWGSEPDGTDVILFRDSEDAEWREIARDSYDDEQDGGDFIPVGFSRDNKRLYFLSAGKEKTYGLYALEPGSGKEPQLLYRDATYDMDDVLYGRRRGEAIGVQWLGERLEWRYFEPHHPDVASFDAIRRAFGGRDLSIVDRAEDGSRAVAFVDSDVEPGAYYLLDLVKVGVLARFPTRPWIDSKSLHPMQPISLTARDGTALHGYLTRPANQSEDAKKKLVVLVHGGPIGVRDVWGYDREVQWLASNGYSVLQVNFRGSGGYGPEFTAAGYGEYGGKMQDDVTDATRWAIEQGHADPSAICIYGGSYGGYAAMMGLIKEPGLYRCGIGYSGLYDLEIQKRESDVSRSSEGRASMDAEFGEDREQLRRNSPALRAAEITVPVLLVHGGQDERTPIEQFRAMQAALQKAGKRFEVLVKRDEDHGFRSEANVAEFYRKLVEFLDAHTR